MNFSPIKPALFVCLLIGSNVLGMEPGNNAPQQEQVVPGRFNEFVCLICHEDYRELIAGRVPVVFPSCRHWVCSDCMQYVRDRCPYCSVPLPMPDIPDVYQVVSQGNLEQLRILIAAGVYVNVADDFGETPLHRAVDYAMPLYLFIFNGEVNGEVTRATILEIIRTLIAAGANVNAADHGGFTPLHHARDVEIMRTLIAAGANVNAADHRGFTPLLDAVLGSVSFSCEIERVRALIAVGADVHIRDLNGRTPLDIANQFCNRDDNVVVAEMLRQAGAQ